MDPVACVHGDIFCRECALNNILAQKKEIKRLEKARENEEKDAAEEKARQDEEAQARAVKEFELVQAGFDVKETGERRAGEKRKAPLDEDEVQGQDDRAKARKSNENEKVRTFIHDPHHSRDVLILDLTACEKCSPVFLGTICDTNVQFEGQVARGQEKDKNLPNLSVI